MSRQRNIIPSVQINPSIPEDLYTKMTLHLFSEVEGKIPCGAQQRFFTELLREFFDHRGLDLAPWADVPPGAFVVRGSPATLELVKKLLGEAQNED